MADSSLEKPLLAELLREWFGPAFVPGSLLDVQISEQGTIHQTRLLETTSGRYALRRYRYGQDRHMAITYEHALSQYVHEQGLPAIPPLPLLNGGTWIEHEGVYYALYPFAPGRQVARQELSSHNLWAMGQCLARLHTVLRDYPCVQVTQRNFHFNMQKTFAYMGELEEIIRARPRIQPQDEIVLAHLAARRAWLLDHQDDPFSDFHALHQQVIHGDYQETNLFFIHDEVSAIIDWDQAYSAPAAWEIVRILDIVCDFAKELCQAFLDGYRALLPLSHDELDLLIYCYGWMRAQNLWLYEELYIEGNERVRRFLPDGPFIPISEKWERIKI